VGDRTAAGFDTEVIDSWIGLQPADESHKTMSETLIGQDLQTCPRSHEE
jgi:hypothetical protein